MMTCVIFSNDFVCRCGKNHLFRSTENNSSLNVFHKKAANDWYYRIIVIFGFRSNTFNISSSSLDSHVRAEDRKVNILNKNNFLPYFHCAVGLLSFISDWLVSIKSLKYRSTTISKKFIYLVAVTTIWKISWILFSDWTQNRISVVRLSNQSPLFSNE